MDKRHGNRGPTPVDNTPGVDPRHPAAAIVQDIVNGKARSLERTGMAEINFEIEVEVEGVKVKDNGCIRRDPFSATSAPPSRGRLFDRLTRQE